MLTICSGPRPRTRASFALRTLEVQVRRTIDVVLIVGFVILDWLRFHDMLKPEAPTAADWLTGALSLLVFYVAASSLLEARTQQRLA